MSAGFDFNNITLQDTADITKIMENFEKIENDGITDAKATRLATTAQAGWMSAADKTKLDTLNSNANGTITRVTAGTGLTGGGTTGAVTLNASFGTAAGTICEGNDSRLSNARTPTSHATSSTTYGVGTTSAYGHCMTINNLNTSAHANGKALSAYQGYLLNNNKLEKSAKANTQQAQTGTDDTTYMTPLKVSQAMNLKATTVEASADYSKQYTSNTNETTTYTFNTKSRFVMITLSNRTDFTASGGSCDWGIFDCARNSFLFSFTSRDVGDKFNLFATSINIIGYLSRGSLLVTLDTLQYSNGGLSFKLTGRVTSSVSATAYVRVVPLSNLSM